MKIAILLVMFLVLSALLIISNNNLAFYKTENIDRFSSYYLGWMDQTYSNVEILTGNAIKLDWFPKQNP